MDKKYRLEFNEKTQQFHHDNYSHEENTHGWQTIINHCNDYDFRVFESFINRGNKKTHTVKSLLKDLEELNKFTSNLSEYKLTIKK